MYDTISSSLNGCPIVDRVLAMMRARASQTLAEVVSEEKHLAKDIL